MEKKSILIVEDSHSDSEALRSMFKKLDGFKLQFAADGQEAISALGKEYFDILITDIYLPKSSGLSIIKKLKASQNDSDKKTFIIVCSSSTDKIVHNKLKDLKIDGFIEKPYSLEKFKSLLGKA